MKFRKQILLLFPVLGINISVFGQEHISLTNDDLIPWSEKGISFALNFDRINLLNTPVWLYGGQLSFIHKHWLSTGFYYYASPSAIYLKDRFVEIKKGGLNVQLLHKSGKLFFLSAGTSIGIGEISEQISKDHTFLFAEPECRLWLNVTSFMRLSLLVAYRLTKSQYLDIDLTGNTLGISIVYGKF